MNNVCLITGASGGIGAAIAIEMAASGFSLYLHYNENLQAAKQVAKKCEKYGVKTAIVQADLATKAGVDRLLKQIPQEIDLFIHNSGNSHYGLFTDISYEEIEKMIFLHITSALIISQKLLPAMIRKKQGNIIVISSIWGLTGASCEVVYSTVKGALNSFVKALAKEVGPSNIRVNGIAPGAIDTKMLAEFTEDERKAIAEEIPLSRIGKPKEVADLVHFLVSDKAAYITGQIISVNGGWYC